MKKLFCIIIIMLLEFYLKAQSFPLRIGNSWTQKDQYENRETFTIVDSGRAFNGKKYFVSNKGLLMRLDSIDNIHYYVNPSNGQEIPYYKADINLNDTVRFLYYGQPSFMKCEYIGSSIVFGQNTKIRIISYNYGGLIFNEKAWSDKFGMLSSSEPHTGSLWSILLGCVIDGVVYGDTTTVNVNDYFTNNPNEFVLFQNYPNPFNPSTIIRYQIPKSGIVRLKIYDVLGKEVATLVDEYKEAGRYEVELNVGQSNSLSSGVYIYRLTSGNYTASRKMMIIK